MRMILDLEANSSGEEDGEWIKKRLIGLGRLWHSFVGLSRSQLDWRVGSADMGSNFHNYTVGKPFNDKTVKRFMISLEVRDPQVVGDIEWISVRIHGQSFMLHQIVRFLSSRQVFLLVREGRG